MSVAQLRTDTALPFSSPFAQTYERLWDNATYRRYAPGEHYIDDALEVLKPRMGASFIDFGCGTGRPALELRKRGYGVVGIDFAENSLDEGIDIPFLVADLAKKIDLKAQFGFCTDVMEHVAPEHIDDVLLTIADCVRQGVFFSIAMDHDQFGPMLVGSQLHLTVQDAKWWRRKMGQFWPRVVMVSNSDTLLCLACFANVENFREGVKIEALANTPDDVIFSHVAANSKRAIPWLEKSEAGPCPCLIVGGGPSLRDTLPSIKVCAKMGWPVFALNAAAKFLSEHDVPNWQIMIDPREGNLDYLDDKASGYILASQCHPALFDRLEGQSVVGFHVAMEGIGDHIADLRTATLIGGGITSGLTALALVYTLGYREIHLHGYDSSDAEDGNAHAYAQDETRAEKKRLNCKYRGKHYRCSFAMYKQAEEFEKFSRMLADMDAVIHVHGSGLLPDIAKAIAEKQAEAEELAAAE